MKKSFFILVFFLFAGLASGQTFYDHYSKGQKSQKKERWEEAIQSYLAAIKLKSDDGERVRTYGVNFIDYFPNREIGIVYFELEDYDKARTYLGKSQQDLSSERATFYLSRLPQTEKKQSEVLAQKTDESDSKTTNLEPTKVENDPDSQGKDPGLTGDKTPGPSGETETAPSGETIVKMAAVVPVPLKDQIKPSIKITSPALLDFRSLNPVKNDVKQITITGKVADQSGIYEVLVNGNDATITSTGDFSAVAYLSVGSNTIIVQATDIYQNTEVREITVVRQDMAVAKNVLMDENGKYYALIIGVSKYKDPGIPDLDGLPVRDAALLTKTLM